MEQHRPSKKQQALLAFVDAFVREHGYGPSYREIMRGLDYKSVSTVAVHVEGLIAKGLMARRDNSARSLEVLHLDVTQAQQADQLTEGLSRRIAEADLDEDTRQRLVESLKTIGITISNI